MNSDIFSKVERATVTITRWGGQGILVKNQLILTACHCIEYSLTGGMTLGDYYFEKIKTHKGNLLVSSPLCLEPISDIAVLGEPDNQELFDEAELFEQFCRDTRPLKVCRDKLEVKKEFKIFIYTHEKRWITGFAQIYRPESTALCIQTEEPIKGGTSGSGVINEKGELVGIVSWATEGSNAGVAVRPLLALPTFICRRI